MHIREAHVSTTESPGELGVVHAKEVEHRGVEVVDLDLVLNRMVAVVVGRTVDGSALDSPSGKPHGEAERVVVATVRSLRHGGSTELASPEHERTLQQASGLEVFQQTSDSAIDRAGVVLVAFLEVGMLIPTVATNGRAEHSTNRTPRSTSRRAVKQLRPNACAGP